jgi:hypothetical protein
MHSDSDDYYDYKGQTELRKQKSSKQSKLKKAQNGKQDPQQHRESALAQPEAVNTGVEM